MIDTGGSRTVAAEAAGISRGTIYGCRIARGAGIMTTVTEELDASGNVKTRTSRTVTGQGSWQAYAWMLERRHPERWARTERPAAGDGAGTLDPEEVIARGEAQMRLIEGAGSREPDHLRAVRPRGSDLD